MDNPTPQTEQISYFDKRMLELGVTEENNFFVLNFTNTKGEADQKKVPVFKPHAKGIEIMVPTVNGNYINYNKKYKDGKERRWKDDYSIIRLEVPVEKKDGSLMKYELPNGQSTEPFFHQLLISNYREKKQTETLILTEGYFKAFKACMHGIPCVGLASITTLKNKETGNLHEDVIEYIKVCGVKRLIWLHDGDCIDISKEFTSDKDLYKRPFNFFRSVQTFYDIASQFKSTIPYFAHINTENIVDNPKGLDDLLMAHPDKVNDITSDLFNFASFKSGQYVGNYFVRFNLDMTSMGVIRKHFLLHDVAQFYLHHSGKCRELYGNEFVFNGTRYKYNAESNECEIIVPGDSKKFFRVTDDYFEFVEVPNRFGRLETQIIPRKESNIAKDHAKIKDFIKHIPKYKSYCTVPDHVNYQQVIHGCFNMYAPFEHEPEEGDYSTIIEFVKHIFGEREIEYTPPFSDEAKILKNYELGLDYIQILYQRPWQILPILTLVSNERQTGKTKFLELMKEIYKQNAIVVNNDDLESTFNKIWSSKLLIMCDELLIEKQKIIEKVKSLSTASRTVMNSKGKDQTEREFFGKFIFATNNEENFAPIHEEEIRFWVIKVPVVKKRNVNLVEDMTEQIPAFLHYLKNRKMVTENEERHWFNSKLLITDALHKVVANSKPTIEKEIRSRVRSMFMDFEEDEVYLEVKTLHEWFPRFERNYIERVLEDRWKLSRETVQRRYHWKMQEVKKVVARDKGTSIEEIEIEKIKVNTHGRHFIFHRNDFIDQTPNEDLPF